MKTLVLGIGNPILRDDGVGLRVASELLSRITDPEVVVDTAYTGGFNLLDSLRGFEKVILIDALSDTKAAGTVRRFLLADARTKHSCNLHDCSLQEALHLARTMGDTTLPKEVVVVGVSVLSTHEFGEELSPAVQRAIPKAMDLVLEELSKGKEGTP